MEDALKDNLEKTFFHCQSHLSSLFGLEPTLEVKVAGEETEGDMTAIDLDYFYKGRLVKCESIELQLAESCDPFLIAAYTGRVLYEVANPEIKQQGLAEVRKLMGLAKRQADEDTSALSQETNANEGDNLIVLSQIVSYCCAFAYRNIIESGADPLKDSKESADTFWQAMVTTTWDLAEPLFRIFANDHHSRVVAGELYKKEGYKVIEKLAPLTYRQARQTIADILGRDVFLDDFTAPN